MSVLQKAQVSMNRLVVRLPNWIGDAVMATSMLVRLRTLLPQAHIAAVALPHILELYEGLDVFDQAILFHKDQKERVLAELQSLRADCGLLCTGSFSSAYLFFQAHIPVRIGFVGHWRRIFLTHPLARIMDESIHDVERCHALLSFFDPLQSEIGLLHLRVKSEETKALEQRLQSLRIGAEQKLLIVNPGAAYGSAKCWPSEYFCKALRKLLEDPLLCVIIIGDRSIENVSKELVHVCPERVFSLAGATTLRELMALIARANCLLTNDSGPMHMAAALRTPLVAIFGSTSPARTCPWKWGKVLYEGVSCSPCFKRVCPSDFRCMKKITPERVVSIVQEFIPKAKNNVIK